MRVSVFDPSKRNCSLIDNMGDLIIMNYIIDNISEIFPYSLLTTHSSKDKLFIDDYLKIMFSSYTFFGGSNFLTSKMDVYKQFNYSFNKSMFIKNVILMGVGWWQYQDEPNEYTISLLSKFMCKKYLHSVRDDYTKDMLNSVGFNNVINTSCPTIWRLGGRKKVFKKKDALFTLTDYNKDHFNDKRMIKELAQNYRKLYFYPQGYGDLQYLNSIGHECKVYILSRDMNSLNNLLCKNEVDYVGTRLHCGVHALNYGVRSLVVGIDNRAIEISNETNLPVIKRGRIGEIRSWINECVEIKINVPSENISIWKRQFHNE